MRIMKASQMQNKKSTCVDNITDAIADVKLINSPPELTSQTTAYPSPLFPNRICTFERKEKKDMDGEVTIDEKKSDRYVLYIPKYLSTPTKPMVTPSPSRKQSKKQNQRSDLNGITLMSTSTATAIVKTMTAVKLGKKTKGERSNLP